MNVWKLTAAKKLELAEEPIPAASEGKIKVRVTKVLLSDMDASVYRGDVPVKYPLIPGSFAVGIVAEDFGDTFPKGTRVLMHAFLPAEDSGTEQKDFTEDDYDVCGQSRDGYLRELIVVSPDEITPLPDSVNDELGLLLHHVAFAKTVVEKLAVGKGQHVAVIGADAIGILVCQLLIYQQAAPVLIDADNEKLNFARACGVYYTLQSDENLLKNIAAITGGRLAYGSVFVTDADGNDPALAFLMSAQNSNVVIGGFRPFTEKLDLETAIRRQLTVHCLSQCADNPEQAINLAANHAVDMSQFRADPVNANAIAQAFAERAETGDRDVFKFTYFKLL